MKIAGPASMSGASSGPIMLIRQLLVQSQFLNVMKLSYPRIIRRFLLWILDHHLSLLAPAMAVMIANAALLKFVTNVLHAAAPILI